MKKVKMSIIFAFGLIGLAFLLIYGCGKNSGVNEKDIEIKYLQTRLKHTSAWALYYRKALADTPKVYILAKRSDEEDVPDTGSEIREAMLAAESQLDDTQDLPPHQH